MANEVKRSLIDYWRRSGFVKDKRLLNSFEEIPREKFILKGFEGEAYGDYPLPIPGGQTISQPTTIIMMIGALELKPEDVVLEIGAGSGYNAALMSKLCKKVYTTEVVPELIGFARKNLESAGIKNVEVIETDGSQGFAKKAPYDKIIVTAACPSIPPPLIDQLKEGGIIVAPVGPLYDQEMIKGIKRKGKLETVSLGYFAFVPLKGKYGHY